MLIVEIRKELIQNEINLDRLFEIELHLQDKIAEMYTELPTSDKFSKPAILADINMCKTLLNICKERQSSVKDAGRRFNYNFRMIAKEKLSPELYNEICDKAYLPYSKRKKQIIDSNN